MTNYKKAQMPGRHMNSEAVIQAPTTAPTDIVERTALFADRVIKLALALPNNVAGKDIGRQLIRAAMSVGANVEEAQAGESKSDFIHKLKISRKECREAKFFLVRIANAELVAPGRLDDLIDEASQLLLILTSIIRNSGG
ncbi:MAG: four helix bundle protein [Phycisphaerales bacterium]|nr:MAG: four helix bundle protein [Phycisphaerales bacterium]